MGEDSAKTGRAVPRLRISSWVGAMEVLPMRKESPAGDVTLKPQALSNLDKGRGNIDDISLLRTITVNPADLTIGFDYYGLFRQKPGKPAGWETYNDAQLSSYYRQVIDACHERRIECLVGFALGGPAESSHQAFTKWIRDESHPLSPADLAKRISAFIQEPSHGLAKCDGISFDIEGVGTGVSGAEDDPDVMAAEERVRSRFSELYGTLADELAKWTPPDVGIPIGHIVAVTPAAVIGSRVHSGPGLIDLDGKAIIEPVVHRYQVGGEWRETFDVTSRYYENHTRVGPFWNPGVQSSAYQGARDYFLQDFDLGNFYSNILIRPMVYDGLELSSPSAALENWQYDVIRYARHFARVPPSNFQLGIKTAPGTPQTVGFPVKEGDKTVMKKAGGVSSPAHIERIAKGLLRHTNTGAALFPASVGTWKALNDSLNKSVGAPDAGTVEMQPLQAPIKREVIEKRFGG